MRKLNIAIIFSTLVWLTACKRDDAPVVLPQQSVGFQQNTEKDTIEVPLSILKDSTLVYGFKAALSGTVAPKDVIVTFAVDTTKIADYRAEYGEAMLLPSNVYLFFKNTSRIPAGGTVSDSAQLNIGQQTRLIEYSTYVLPVVIQSVNGRIDGTATERVIYMVFKTGKPLVINKTGWAIASYSSHFSNFQPSNLLDANTTLTYWASNIAEQMPQYVTINFNRDILFSGMSYSLPNALSYPSLGGYPTLFRIETSMNGTNWTDHGTFTGTIVANKQTVDLGPTTARYLRYTILECVKYANSYEAVFISDISLIP
ncbi:MAG TPA: DUF1735 domain-containing protein [Parasegetibacter sp.]